jgi:DNA polymerase-3 subunit delta'
MEVFFVSSDVLAKKIGGSDMSGFQEIAGHQKVKDYFKKVLGLGQVSHAYILTGEEGSGRKTLAKAFAMTLLCENSKEEPCGECHSCKQFLADTHPDVIYVTHEKAGSIGVDEVRKQVVNDVSIKPYSSAYKVYIIDEAEKMTQGAQNALLKTIEEPPEYVVLIFITNNAESFLPTILSRCVTLKLQPIYNTVIKEELLKKYDISAQQADLYAALSRGSLGKALTYVESEEFQKVYDCVMELVHTKKDRPVYQLLDVIKRVQEHVFEVIELLRLWYRDVTVFKASMDLNLLIFKDDFIEIKKAAPAVSFPGLEQIATALDKAEVRLKANVNFELAMELLLITIKEN